MQIWVLYGIMLNILNKKKVTRQYLAEKFEMSTRSISRYIDTLAESGVPIYSNPGREGGYSISSEYKFDNTVFSQIELTRIQTCLNSIKNDRLNQDILDKIEHMSLRKSDTKYLLSNDKLVIDASSWSNPESFRNKIEEINKAIDKSLSIELCYTDRYDANTNRLFDPYCLALKEGIWYTYGWCHKRNDFRLFKLSRISSINETSETYVRRESNIYEKLMGNLNDIETIDLEIKFSSTILGDIEEWLGIDAISERGLDYIARATVYSGNILIKKLLSFGSSITVLKPHFVREELLVECKRILRDANVEY